MFLPALASVLAPALMLGAGLATLTVLAGGRLSALRDMGQELLHSGLDAQSVCSAIRRFCAPAARRAELYVLLSDEQGRLTQAHWQNPRQNTPAEMRSCALPTAADGDLGVWAWLAAEQRTLLASDAVRNALPFAPLSDGAPVRSALYVPILAERELLGAIALESPSPNALEAEQRELVEIVAAQAALGLQAARLTGREQQRSAQLLLIAEVSRKVTAILDLKTLFADTVRLIQDALGYYHVCIFTVQPQERRITLQASTSARVRARGLNIGWGRGLIGHVARTGEIALANNVMHDARFVHDTALEATRSEFAIPLRVEKRILGILDLQSDRVDAFNQRDVPALQVLADQVAVAIEDSRIYERQQEQSWVATALLQVAEAVAQASATEEIVATVARLSQMLAGMDACLALLWDEEAQAFRPVAMAGYRPARQMELTQLRLTRGAYPCLDRALMTAETDTCSASDLPELWPDGSDAQGQGSGRILPLRTQGQVTGLLVALRLGPDPLTAPQQTILVGIANYAAIALDNARLLASQREEAWVSAALLQVATVIGQTAYDRAETLATVVRLAPMLLGVPWCAVMLWDEERGGLAVAESHGVPESEPGLRAGALHHAWDRPFVQPLLDGQEMVSCTAGGAVESNCLVYALRARERLLGALAVGLAPQTKTIAGRRLSILSGIAYQAALAVETSLLYEATVRQERLQHEMTLARRIQQSFLPERPPQVEGWALAVDWRAVRGVGGDFYDFIALDERHLGLLIADVSDKGVGAALYMALSRTVVRAAALGSLSPAETLARANRVLLQDARSGMFVSIFYGILDLATGALTYARAGHNPPLFLRAATGAVSTLYPQGVILGVTDEPLLEEAELAVQPGDVLLMYTDGVTEAIDAHEDEFGEERLYAVLQTCAGASATTVVERVNAAVHAFIGDQAQSDDYTLLVLTRPPERAP